MFGIRCCVAYKHCWYHDLLGVGNVLTLARFVREGNREGRSLIEVGISLYTTDARHRLVSLGWDLPPAFWHLNFDLTGCTLSTFMALRDHAEHDVYYVSSVCVYGQMHGTQDRWNARRVHVPLLRAVRSNWPVSMYGCPLDDWPLVQFMLGFVGCGTLKVAANVVCHRLLALPPHLPRLALGFREYRFHLEIVEHMRRSWLEFIDSLDDEGGCFSRHSRCSQLRR